MQKIDFNTGWTCRSLQGGDAYPVILPHDAMRTEERVSTSLGEANIGYFEGLDYEYRKVFTVPAELSGKELTLEFESVYRNAEVYVNGEKAAYRPYGYTNFYVPLNEWLKEGENEIIVKAFNSEQPNSRWYSGTGIYRPVWLYAADEKHVEMNGVKIRTLSVDPAVIEVKIATNAAGTVQVEIVEDGCDQIAASAQAQTEGQVTLTIEVPDAKLWNVGEPNLYQAKVSFEGDEVTETFGIRTLTWDEKKGVAINGKRCIIRGACIHHDNGLLGAASYPEVEERRIRILTECGYNAVRSAHNPASKYQLDACDRLGVLMMDEYVDCWYMHKTDKDYASYVEQWWKEDMRDMVDKDYNHPCVIIYSTGNEVAETAQKRGIALQNDFTRYLHSLDDSRPVTCGINIFFNFLSSVGFGVYSDDKAAKQAEAAKKAAAANQDKPKKKPVGSEFFNTMAAKLGTNFMKFGASLPPCDWKTKDAFSVMDIAGYNYGNWRYKKDAKKYPKRLILGSETLVGDAYSFWETAKDVPQVVGDFVWAGMDYIGECGLGGVEYEDYVTDRVEDHIRGGHCRVDATGRKSVEVDYTRVAFELEKGPKLAVFPVHLNKKPEITGWQLTTAYRSWSYPGCDGRKAEITVYARAAEVEVFLNGESIGRKKLQNSIKAEFKTVYHDGELKAVSYDAAGKIIGTDVLVTAGHDTELRLIAETQTCRPGEMVFLRVLYTDTDGVVKVMDKHTVSVEAENAEIMGCLNGSAYFHGRLDQTSVPTYMGEAQTIVRAGEAGEIRVKVSDGKRCAEVTICCEA